jgi:hypothetical protein
VVSHRRFCFHNLSVRLGVKLGLKISVRMNIEIFAVLTSTTTTF